MQQYSLYLENCLEDVDRGKKREILSLKFRVDGVLKTCRRV
jgi:hypothetical protein